ncbi:MAG: PH domain-containing protein [Clostridia bacterium]|nr:PH domain-containing protein [Clostridia bacterium]
MLDFEKGGLFPKAKRAKPGLFEDMVDEFLLPGEEVLGSYKSKHDGVVFTDRRIIAVGTQGFKVKKKKRKKDCRDITVIPYSKITAFSVESSSSKETDSELEIFIADVGTVRVEFVGVSTIRLICKHISEHILK